MIFRRQSAPVFRRRLYIQLDETSWLSMSPDWLQGSSTLFKELLRQPSWEQRYRVMFGRRLIEPRLTAECLDIADAPQALLYTVRDAGSHPQKPTFYTIGN